jgi:hypothetical protein
VSWYDFNINIDATVNNEEDIDQEVIDFILESYPIFNIFFNDYDISKNGRVSQLYYGYRYYFQIGYMF